MMDAKPRTEGLLVARLLLLGALPVALLAGCDNRHNLERTPDASPDTSSLGGSGGTGTPDGGSGGQSSPSDAMASGGSSGSDASVAPEVGPLGPSSSWTGYIENHRFPSGSDVLKLTFASDPAGLIVGKVTLGMGTAPPPATDPEAAYPPGSDPRGARGASPVEGFPFSMNGGTLVGRRLRFTLAANELWAGWCALQTPAGSSDRCLPNWGGMASVGGSCSQKNPETGQTVTVSCAKFFMCGPVDSVCTCAAGTCTNTSSADVSFDLAITGDLADGSVVGRLGDRNVHFTKDM